MPKYTSALVKATLIKRYKRFLADVSLANGERVTVHCPNTGAMTNCAEPGWTVYLSESPNPKRKYKYTWELSEDNDNKLIGINSSFANKVVAEALQQRHILELAEYDQISPEIKVGDSRIDFLLQGDGMPDCYLEVKSMTLRDTGGEIGYFPDTVSKRGTKHAKELGMLAQQGHKAVLLFCVQHEGINSFDIAKHIDPEYAETLEDAQNKGLLLLCYKCNFSMDIIKLGEALPKAE
ncbi:DNA/RNA nuclease SfsA [Glaciecola sp. MH2013]|uniref:DNA/RNA nuclease SfsA n=1 Tax=Glaciecola sp. MH2013 TaxID=2785524 RepID=UPI00189FB872|nr:DNA/RNA nuclease SfsA [Glaciecola sp. MH2013]MBF7073831.1 DNA/RNA nuclease SfsA [Glaciecola sp. MH2013]